MKKLLSVLLAVSLLVSVCTAGVGAYAAEEYGPYVNGSQFTGDNLSIACGEGTAVFEPSTSTLTLNNASIATTYEFKPWYEAMIYSELSSLTIVLNGTNVLESTNTYADGMDAAGGCDITITGSGTLNINNAYYGTYIGDWETPGGKLTVKDGATLTVSGTQCASIWVNNDITFIDSTVTVTKTTKNYDGIVSNIGGTVTVNGGTLNVSNYHSAIHFGNGDDSDHAFVVEDGEVNLTSTDGYGITVEPYVPDSSQPDNKEYRGTVTVNGGVLTVNSALGGVTLSEDKITVADNMKYAEGASLTEAGTVKIVPAAEVVTKDNFFNYFDASGELLASAPESLVFTGDFTGLSVSAITLSKAVAITSDNAKITDIPIHITADGVSIEGLEIDVTGKYAVKIDGASNVNVVNNHITFTGDTDAGSKHSALLVNGPADNLNVVKNTFSVSLVSEAIQWVEYPAGSGNWVGDANAVGIEFNECKTVTFAENEVTISGTGIYGGYDTIYGVHFASSDSDAFFNAAQNDISLDGKTYAYAFKVDGKRFELVNNTISCQGDTYAVAADIGLNTEDANSALVNNSITVESPASAYGFTFSSGNNGNSAGVTVISNHINTNGHLCYGVNFRDVSSVRNKSITAPNNTITGTGDYLNGIAVIGAADCTIISNTMDVCGTNTGATDSFYEPAFRSEYGSCGVYTDSQSVVVGNTITSSGIGVLNTGNCTIANDRIKTTGEYTVEVTEADAIVKNCTLNAQTRYGDDSVKHNGSNVADNKHAHAYTETVVAPTCTEKGKTVHTCTYCGDSYDTDEVAALGHSLGAWKETAAAVTPTCTKAGATAIEKRTCTRSGCDYSETRGGKAIASLDHNPAAAVEENRVAATCTKAGSYDLVVYCSVCGAERSRVTKTVNALGHDFGNNEAKCKRCGAVNPDYKEPEKPTEPDQPVLTPEEKKMPTEKKTEQLIKSTNTDKKDISGSEIGRLMLKATTKKRTITIRWKAVSGADGYIIYGSPCGKKLKRMATVKNPKTVKKTFKKLKKGKYYKYVVVAYKKTAAGNRIITKSKSVHCVTPGGKKGNPTGIRLKKNKYTLKKGKKVKIKATLLSKKKVSTHIATFRYESSNKKIATVTKNGVIKAKKKGTATIYVYAQNGLCKKIKVKVKG